MLIFDKSDWYPKTVEYLRCSLGWIQIDFHGFGPINSYSWTTTIFINPARHHELRHSRALKSLCGLVQVAENGYQSDKDCIPEAIKNIVKLCLNSFGWDEWACHSWSQEGEDMVLRRLFEHKKVGST